MQLLDARQNKWLFCLVVSFLAFVWMLWPQSLIDFRYERTALESGQWWRAVTGHMVHLNAAHLLLNLAGLILICELLWRDLRWTHGCALLLFSAIGTSALLWWFHPELAWYAGLSGALHGLWAGCALSGWWSMQARGIAATVGFAAAADWRVQMRRTSSRYFFMGALLVLALKLVLEARYGPALHTERMIGGPVVSVAHLYGAVSGIIFVMGWRIVSGLLPRTWPDG